MAFRSGISRKLRARPPIAAWAPAPRGRILGSRNANRGEPSMSTSELSRVTKTVQRRFMWRRARVLAVVIRTSTPRR